jgi:hypothetical protein
LFRLGGSGAPVSAQQEAEQVAPAVTTQTRAGGMSLEP